MTLLIDLDIQARLLCFSVPSGQPGQLFMVAVGTAVFQGNSEKLLSSVVCMAG